jgi:hypothetical protein
VSVLLNLSQEKKSVALEGARLPSLLGAHVTSAVQILGATGTQVRREAIELPPRSITTLISGSHLDEPSRNAPSRGGPDGQAGIVVVPG